MSKILVNDLKNLAKQLPDADFLKVTNEFGEIIHEVSITQYLPIAEKIGLVSSVYKSAVAEDGTLSIINRNALNIAYKILVVKTYSDVNLPKDDISAYDLLTKSRLFDQIYGAIPQEERIELEKVMDDYIREKQERYERENTLPNIVKNLLSGLIEKMPDEEGMAKMITEAKKTMDGFEPDKMEFVKAFLAKTSGEV